MPRFIQSKRHICSSLAFLAFPPYLKLTSHVDIPPAAIKDFKVCLCVFSKEPAVQSTSYTVRIKIVFPYRGTKLKEYSFSSDKDTRSFMQQFRINALKKAADFVEILYKYHQIRKVCTKSGLWKRDGENFLGFPPSFSIDYQLETAFEVSYLWSEARTNRFYFGFNKDL